jgi:hypothetical protein
MKKTVFIALIICLFTIFGCSKRLMVGYKIEYRYEKEGVTQYEEIYDGSGSGSDVSVRVRR